MTPLTKLEAFYRLSVPNGWSLLHEYQKNRWGERIFTSPMT